MISIISDVQLHAYNQFSTILPSGRNSRLQHGVDVIKFAVDRADGGYLVILGDLFEDRRSLTIDVSDAAAECIEYACSKLKGVRIVVGNHDQYFRDGTVHSLRAFQSIEKVKVIDGFHMEMLESKRYMFAAFHDEIAKVADWIKTLPKGILCIHQAIFGAEADGGFLYNGEDSLTLEDVRDGFFTHIFAGHFHKPQTLGKNTHYVGSPYQIKSNEIGQIKRIAVLDGDTLEWVPTEGCPTFRKATPEEYEGTPPDERGKHFWEIDGILGYSPSNVRFKAAPKTEKVYADSCSSIVDAVRSFLTARGRGDLIEQAIRYIT